jgi:hypothetical protein
VTGSALRSLLQQCYIYSLYSLYCTVEIALFLTWLGWCAVWSPGADQLSPVADQLFPAAYQLSLVEVAASQDVVSAHEAYHHTCAVQYMLYA